MSLADYIPAVQRSICFQEAYCPFPDAPGIGFLGAVQSVSPVVDGRMYSYKTATAWVKWSGPTFHTSITNRGTQTIGRFCLSIPAPPLTGTLQTNAPAYGTVKTDGWRMAAPSVNQPLRAFWLIGGQDGVGIIPWSGYRVLVNRWPGQANLHIWLDLAVPPGQTQEASFFLAVTHGSVVECTRQWWAQERGVAYASHAYPAAMANLADGSLVTPQNPLGYKAGCSMVNVSDSGSIYEYAELLPQAGVRDLYMWNQQGWMPPSVNPNAVGHNPHVHSGLQDFTSYARIYDCNAGYASRPGAGVVDGKIVRSKTIERSIAGDLGARGLALFPAYMDSFGGYNGNAQGAAAPAELDDSTIARRLRRDMTLEGIASPCLAELSTEMTWPHLGVYLCLQWDAAKGFWFSGNVSLETLGLIRLAYPGLHACSQLKVPEERTAEAIGFCGDRRVVPLVQAHLVQGLDAAIKNYIATWVDADSGGWK